MKREGKMGRMKGQSEGSEGRKERGSEEGREGRREGGREGGRRRRGERGRRMKWEGMYLFAKWSMSGSCSLANEHAGEKR